MLKSMKGRMLDDTAFTGVVERLTAIAIMCEAAGQATDNLSKDDLVGILSQISGEAIEGLVLTGAERKELTDFRNHLMDGYSVSRERPN